VVICLAQGADLHIAQLMPLPLTVSCFSKIQIGFTFLVPAHLGSPGQRAVKRVCRCGRLTSICSRLQWSVTWTLTVCLCVYPSVCLSVCVCPGVGGGHLYAGDHTGRPPGHCLCLGRAQHGVRHQDLQRVVRPITARLEHGQHDLQSDAGAARGQRGVPGCQQGTDLLRSHGQLRQGAIYLPVCLPFIIIIIIT